MKILLLFSFAALAAFPLDAKASDVTASELAQHLGVSTWRVPESKLPARFMVRVQKVRDGKIDKESNFPGFTFDRKGDLVICAHEENGKIFMTLASGGTSMSPASKGIEGVSFMAKHKIDLKNPLGPHLLGGDYPLRNGGRIATGKYQDATSGLVLFIQPETSHP